MAKYDLLIRDGIVVDGTGATRRSADIAVADGQIVEVGRVTGDAHRVVNADGALVTPGWVDIHTHYDGQATWASQMTPSSWHGVTTAVFGNCGVGFAPVAESNRQLLLELMEGVEDIPGSVLSEGINWDWDDFPSYLDALERTPRDIDVAAQVPHAAVRFQAMGERAALGDSASPDDIVAMGRLVADGIRAGALGFSTSRSILHRSSRDDPTPTLSANEDELVGIARAVGAVGRGVMQVVSDFLDLDGELRLIESMAAASHRPVSLSLMQNPVHPDAWRSVLDRVAQANGKGLTIRAQVAARSVGGVLGLNCTLHPFVNNSVWLEIADRSAVDQARIMAAPDFKARVLEAVAHVEPQIRVEELATFYELMYRLGASPNYEPDPATSVLAQSQATGRTCEDIAYDWLIEDGGSLLYVPICNYVNGNLDVVHEMLSNPFAIPGLSDGGAHVGTICDASYPTTLLQLWARDRASERLPVEFVVERQCRATAEAVGLNDRGVIAPGFRADLNVIDFDQLAVMGIEVANDLPAGGRRLLQRARGYLHTFVRGVETYASGEFTGALPGELVRGGGGSRSPDRPDRQTAAGI